MKPFSIPPWRKAQIERKFRRKDRVIAEVCRRIDQALKSAVDYSISHSHGGHLALPSIDLRKITDQYYIDVVTQAFHACEDEKRAQQGKKRLAQKKGPTKLPPELERVFKNRQYFRALMNRSRRLSDKLQKEYLSKLRRQFQKVLPLVQAGVASPAEVKKVMVKAWEASRPLVETIFRTETTNYFGEAQVSFFKDDDDIIGFLFDSVRDQSRTKICQSRHGLIYTKAHEGKKSIAYNQPALHFNCRSHYIPLARTAANLKMLADRSRNPDHVQVVDLDKRWRK